MALFGVDLKFDNNGKCSEHSDMDLDTNLILQTINIPFVTVQTMSPFYCLLFVQSNLKGSTKGFLIPKADERWRKM